MFFFGSQRIEAKRVNALGSQGLCMPSAPPRKFPGTRPHPEPWAKRVENASLATISGHFMGGVRDPRHAGPVYVEVWPPGPKPV